MIHTTNGRWAALLFFAFFTTAAFGQYGRKLTIQEAKDKLAAEGVVTEIQSKTQSEPGQITTAEQYGSKETGEVSLVVENLASKRSGRLQHISLIEEGGQKRSLNLIEKPDGSLLEWDGTSLVQIDFDVRFGCLVHASGDSKCGECSNKISKCNTTGHITTASRIQCILKVFDSACSACKDDHFNVRACFFQ